MEQRVKKVEDIVAELRSDYKIVSLTLVSIDKTLLELQTQIKTQTEIRILQNSQSHEIEAINSKIAVLFRKTDKMEDLTHTLETQSNTSSIKLGGAEKFTWIVVTAIVGSAIALFKGFQ